MAYRTWLRCEADFLEGLEAIVRDELNDRLGPNVRLLPQNRPDALPFDYNGPLDALLDLRSVVAVSLVEHFAIPRPKALLGQQHMTTLFDAIATARQLWKPASFATLRLNAAGDDSPVMERLKAELEQHTGLQTDPEEGDLLLRIRRVPDGWEVLVRLSPRPLATRPWRVCNMPGALNATVAHAMALQARPEPRDRLLNIVCGSGTLLVERLALARAGEAIGCDLSGEALDCADRNLGAAAGYEFPTTQPIRLEQWDATALPLADDSVDVILGDLPFGQLIGSHRENEQLYPQLIAETARVAALNGRMVLFTHELRLFERVLAQQSAWQLVNRLRVRTGGMTPAIYVLDRVE